MTAGWSSFAVSSGMVHASLGRMMRIGFRGRHSSNSCDVYVMSSFGQRGRYFGR